jgi:hypothetical protein
MGGEMTQTLYAHTNKIKIKIFFKNPCICETNDGLSLCKDIGNLWNISFTTSITFWAFIHFEKVDTNNIYILDVKEL